MSFEIKVGKLRRLLELVSAAKGTSGSVEFDSPTLHVTKEGVEVNELDKSRTMMVQAKFEPEFFEKIGDPFEVTLNTVEVIPFLRKIFGNVEEVVTCKLKGEELVVSSPSEHFKQRVIHKDPTDPTDKLQLEITEDPKYGWLPTTITFETHIRLDPKGITKFPQASYYIFKATQDTLKVGFKEELRAYTKTIPTEEIETDKDALVCTFAGSRVQHTLGQLDEQIWLHLGEDAPMAVHQHDAEFQIMYVVAPYVDKEE